MINTTRTTLVVFTLLVVAALASTLAAQAPGGRGPRGLGPGRGGPGPSPMLQRLDLTDAQKEQVKALTAERAEQGAGRTLANLERDLNAAVMAESPDTAKIEQLKTAIVEAHTAALNERVDLQLRIAQILTPEQRQKARELPPGPRGRGSRF
jgi:Spy/CpxP family protein refolding chaperone